jgi:hypothetical protein
MSPVMTPDPRQAGPGQHPAHRPFSRMGQEPAGQHRERTERRGSEQRPESRQQ